MNSVREALVSLAMTQRRLAHEYRHEIEAEKARGHLPHVPRMEREAARLWSEARWHIRRARLWRNGEFETSQAKDRRD